jgi:hypothetical protein
LRCIFDLKLDTIAFSVSTYFYISYDRIKQRLKVISGAARTTKPQQLFCWGFLFGGGYFSRDIPNV